MPQQSSTRGHRLIGVHAFQGLFAEMRLNHVTHHGHTGLTTHQQDGVHIARLHGSLSQDRIAGIQGSLHQGPDQALELLSGDVDIQVHRLPVHHADEGKAHVHFVLGAQGAFGMLGGLQHAQIGHPLHFRQFAQIELELDNDVIHQLRVKIHPTQESITAGCLNLIAANFEF